MYFKVKIGRTEYNVVGGSATMQHGETTEVYQFDRPITNTYSTIRRWASKRDAELVAYGYEPPYWYVKITYPT